MTGRSVGIIFFLHFFYIFNFCIPDPAENKTKGKELSRRLWCDVFRNLGP